MLWFDCYLNNKLEENWAEQAYKQNIGVILKVGQGRQSKEVYDAKSRPFTDRTFKERYRQAATHNLSFGVYWYCTFDNEESTKIEADYLISILKEMEKETGKKPRFVAIDIEDFTGKPKYNRHSKTVPTEIKEKYSYLTSDYLIKLIKQFAGCIQAAGYMPILYTNLDFLFYVYNKDKYVMQEIPLWLAYYNRDPLKILTQYKLENVYLVQYGTQKISGVSTKEVDVNTTVKALPTDRKEVKKDMNTEKIEAINKRLKELKRHEFSEGTINYLKGYKFKDELIDAIYILATNTEYRKD